MHFFLWIVGISISVGLIPVLKKKQYVNLHLLTNTDPELLVTTGCWKIIKLRSKHL